MFVVPVDIFKTVLVELPGVVRAWDVLDVTLLEVVFARVLETSNYKNE